MVTYVNIINNYVNHYAAKQLFKAIYIELLTRSSIRNSLAFDNIITIQAYTSDPIPYDRILIADDIQFNELSSFDDFYNQIIFSYNGNIHDLDIISLHIYINL